MLSSTKPGTGKSLVVNDRAKKLQAILIDNDSPGIQLNDVLLSLSVQGEDADVNEVVQAIWNHMNACHFHDQPHVFHIDISPSVSSAPQSKKAVCILQINCKLLSFPLEKSC